MEHQNQVLCPFHKKLIAYLINIKNLHLFTIFLGKSTFLSNLIKHKDKVFPEPYAKFLFCSPHVDSSYAANRDLTYQKTLEEFSQPTEIVFFNHIITKEELLEQADATTGNILLLIDDFSEKITNDPLVYDLFSKYASHRKIHTAISLHQGLKSRKSHGNFASLLSQNCNYVVIFRNIANRAVIGEMSKIMFPYSHNFLQRCLNEITPICGQFSYICKDANLRNPLNNKYEIRTNIFKENNLPIMLCKNPTAYHRK